MARHRRTGIDPFGASLLDMMTCSLGAVMLLLLLKRSAGVIESAVLERDRLFRGEVAQTLEERRTTAANWADASLGSLRANGSGALFGIPPVSGDLVLLVDCSPSMVRYGNAKLSRATAALQSVIRSWSAVERIALITFSNTPTMTLPMQDVGDPSVRRGIVDAIPELIRPVDDGQTDLLGAIDLAISTLEPSGRPRRSTILLVSDGLHELDGRQLSPDQMLEELDSRIDRRRSGESAVTIHAIGLFDAWSRGRPMSDLEVTRVTRSMQAAGVAGEQDLALPMALQRLRATPDLSKQIQLGDSLRRICGAFGGRAVFYPVMPVIPDAR